MSLADDLALILESRDLVTTDQTTGRLPAVTEATLPAVLGKSVANGIAALNGAGVPVTAAGVPMAVIGTTTGTAADAGAVATALNNLAASVNAATAQAAKSAVYHFAVNGSYPGRPVTAAGQPVIWASADVVPPAFGTVTSQTGPVDGLDLVLLSSGLQVAT